MIRSIVTATVLACAARLGAQAPETPASPMYMNAVVVRADANARTLTFRGTDGAQSVLRAEGGAVASLAGLRPGDKVIVTYRDGAAPADRRVTGIRPTSESAAVAAPAPPSAPVPSPAAARPGPGAFDGSASAAAATAAQVDRAWATHRQLCVKGTAPVNARGREWFGMLDGSMPRPTDDTCGRSYDTVAAGAKEFAEQVAKLRASAAGAGVLPGELRDTLQRYNIDL